MLASQAAVALDNAQWSQGLEQKVAERTEELNASNAKLEQRANELAIINSIQQGIAAELDFKAIVDLVGDKLREVFATPDLGIIWYEEPTNLLHYLYVYEHGKAPDAFRRNHRDRMAASRRCGGRASLSSSTSRSTRSTGQHRFPGPTAACR